MNEFKHNLKMYFRRYTFNTRLLILLSESLEENLSD